MTEPGSIELRVENPLDFERRRSPVTLGVPFPEGKLRSIDNIALADEAGQPIPCQVRELLRWRDGSLKWLLLDYQANLGPQETRSYRLQFGPGIKRADGDDGIIIQEDNDQIQVANDALRFTVPKKRFAIFETLTLDGQEIITPDRQSDLVVIDKNGEEYRASQATNFQVDVEEKGGLRSVIRISGKHFSRRGASLLDYVLKIYVYAHSSSLILEHTFVNREEPEEGVGIDSISLAMSLHLGQDNRRQLRHLFGDYLRRVRLVRVREAVEIRIEAAGMCRVADPALVDDRPEFRPKGLIGRACPGLVAPWVDVSDGSAGLISQVAHAEENHPKSLVAEDNRIEHHLWPRWAGTLTLRQGMAKTHRLFLCFHAGVKDEPIPAPDTLWQTWPDLMPPLDEREKRLYLVRQPVYAVVPSEWYRRCRVNGLGQAFAYQPGKYPRLELFFHGLFAKDWPTGMINYGDDVCFGYTGSRWYEGKDVWTNNEYDFIHVAFTQYCRSGSYVYFRDGMNSAQHLIDVDFIHYSSDPERMGGPSYHSPDHTTGSLVPSHMFVQGLLDCYCLTGKPEALETAVAIGETLVSICGDPHRRWMIDYDSREGGWPLIALSSLYEATHQERFRAAARSIIDNYVKVRAERKGNFYGENATFGVAIALMGIECYHRAIQDEKARELFLGVVDWWIANRYTPEGVPCGGWGMEGRRPLTQEAFLFLEPLAYAYQITGDVRYVKVGLPELRHHFTFHNTATIPKDSKQITMFYRTIVNFLRAADEAGLLGEFAR